MSDSILGVIGTAGRGQDKQLLTPAHYHRMVDGTIRLINHLQLDTDRLRLVSGGAAWADHIVVSLVLLNVVKNPKALTVYLPAVLTTSPNGTVRFDDRSPRMAKTASTANYYHQLFSTAMGYDTLQQLGDLGHNGAQLIAGNGNFRARNADVAKSLSTHGHLLAFTTGDTTHHQRPWTVAIHSEDASAQYAGLKDGGTAHTWNLARCRKYHGKIGAI